MFWKIVFLFFGRFGFLLFPHTPFTQLFCSFFFIPPGFIGSDLVFTGFFFTTSRLECKTHLEQLKTFVSSSFFLVFFFWFCVCEGFRGFGVQFFFQLIEIAIDGSSRKKSTNGKRRPPFCVVFFSSFYWNERVFDVGDVFLFVFHFISARLLSFRVTSRPLPASINKKKTKNEKKNSPQNSAIDSTRFISDCHWFWWRFRSYVVVLVIDWEENVAEIHFRPIISTKRDLRISQLFFPVPSSASLK